MVEVSEGGVTKGSGRRNVRLVRDARLAGTPKWRDDRGQDGDSALKGKTELPPYSEALAKTEEAARQRKKLADSRLGIGQVNTAQPVTGGKIEPDKRDGVRH